MERKESGIDVMEQGDVMTSFTALRSSARGDNGKRGNPATTIGAPVVKIIIVYAAKFFQLLLQALCNNTQREGPSLKLKPVLRSIARYQRGLARSTPLGQKAPTVAPTPAPFALASFFLA
jgi:hypothetical protein